MGTVHAVYEDGVFKPTRPVQLPEASEVEFEPRLIGPVPADLPDDDWAARFEAWQRRVRSRADRYPHGFEADVSREAMYDGCGE